MVSKVMQERSSSKYNNEVLKAQNPTQWQIAPPKLRRDGWRMSDSQKIKGIDSIKFAPLYPNSIRSKPLA